MYQSSSERARRPTVKRFTVYLNKERREFHDFRTGSPIRIPREREARKQLLWELFCEAAKPVFLYSNYIQMSEIFKWIPEKLWFHNFTKKETEEIIEMLQMTFFAGIMGRLRLVMQKWALLDGYPRIPKSLKALYSALGRDQREVRRNYFKSLLREPSLRSDGWLKFLFEELEPIVNLDAILDPSHPDNEREGFATHVARLAERMVENWLVAWIWKAKKGQRLEWNAVCWDIGC